MARSERVRGALAFCVGLLGACTTAAPSMDDATTATSRSDDPRLPAWTGLPDSIRRDAKLEEAAALLCARDTDGVLDEDVRRATGLSDGIVLGLLERGATAEADLARDAGPLAQRMGANVAGAVRGATSSGEPCAALVAVTRMVSVSAPLAPRVPSGGAQVVELHVDDAHSATLYVLKPDGFVDKSPVKSGGTRISVPAKGDGRYVLEIIVDVADAADANRAHDPQVALLWPYIVGTPKAPPFPEVLFPDEGHDDIALTHRAEALVQRLRNEQLIDPFKVSPPLVEVATLRAQQVAQAGTLGHRVGGVDVAQAIRARFGDEPRGQFVRIAEVQAHASTLADAWQAMTDSPAHRFALVDTAYTHSGVAVARGQDAAGRTTVTMVAILARRPPQRDPVIVREHVSDVVNAERDKVGYHALAPSAHLDRIATRLAEAMRDAGRVDENLLGSPVGAVALEADASLNEVKPYLARMDDPMMLVERGPPKLLMDIDADRMGLGVAVDASGTFWVCVLAGK